MAILMPRRVIGYNASVATTEETVGEAGAAYTFPLTALATTLSSGDANDTSAGTGAQTVQIEGLLAGNAVSVETASMSGQTGVAIAAYLRINSIRVLTAGSGGVNAGIIYVGTGTVTTGVPAVINGRIAVAQNRTQPGIYTVPTGWRAYLDSVEASVYGNAAVEQGVIRILARPSGGVFENLQTFTIEEGKETWDFGGMTIQPGTDLDIRALAETTTVNITCALNLRMERN